MSTQKPKEIEETIEAVDLFDRTDLIPVEVKEIIDRYSEEVDGDELSYEQLGRMQNDVEKVGYTFDYYLDAIPHNLRKK